MSDKTLHLHHVGIVVQDLAASVAWYRDNLGFERQFDFSFPGAQVTMIARGSARLELFQIDGAAPMAAERQQRQTNLKIGGINHLALGVDDLDGVLNVLREKGVTVVSGPSDLPTGSGDRYAFIHDNEGMLVELFQPAD